MRTSTDSVCTVIFVATILCFALGRARRSLGLFAVSGLLASLAFQFRPNFVLFPFYAAVLYLASDESRHVNGAEMLIDNAMAAS